MKLPAAVLKLFIFLCPSYIFAQSSVWIGGHVGLSSPVMHMERHLASKEVTYRPHISLSAPGGIHLQLRSGFGLQLEAGINHLSLKHEFAKNGGISTNVRLGNEYKTYNYYLDIKYAFALSRRLTIAPLLGTGPGYFFSQGLRSMGGYSPNYSTAIRDSTLAGRHWLYRFGLTAEYRLNPQSSLSVNAGYTQGTNTIYIGRIDVTDPSGFRESSSFRADGSHFWLTAGLSYCLATLPKPEVLIPGDTTDKKSSRQLPKNTIYGEIAGSGYAPLSVFYERLFYQGLNHKFAAGIGLSSYTLSLMVTSTEGPAPRIQLVPMHFSILHGRNKHYLETGISLSYLIHYGRPFHFQGSDYTTPATRPYLWRGLVFAYRYYATKGFFLRAAVNFQPEVMPGVGIGYSF